MANEPGTRQYLERYFRGFEPALREKLIENCTVQSYHAGEPLMSPGEIFRGIC